MLAEALHAVCMVPDVGNRPLRPVCAGHETVVRAAYGSISNMTQVMVAAATNVLVYWP